VMRFKKADDQVSSVAFVETPQVPDIKDVDKGKKQLAGKQGRANTKSGSAKKRSAGKPAKKSSKKK